VFVQTTGSMSSSSLAKKIHQSFDTSGRVAQIEKVSRMPPADAETSREVETIMRDGYIILRGVLTQEELVRKFVFKQFVPPLKTTFEEERASSDE
jgi:hypothetical protein